MPVLSCAAKLFPINLSLIDQQYTQRDNKRHVYDRGPVTSEEKYHTKVLIGNWFERRAPNVPFTDELVTIYEQDYKPHCGVAYKKNDIPFWDNKIRNEGVPKSVLMGHPGKAYVDNMTTMNDLCYRILPAKVHKPRIYNIRKKKWIPEQDLTQNFGNLTHYGIKDALEAVWERDSEEAMKYCRWRSTYQDEYRTREFSLGKKPYHRRRADMNKPSLGHLYPRPVGYMNGCPIAFQIPNNEIVRQN